MSAGVPINDVQRVMGHEQASTTLDRYTHRSPDGNRRVLGGLAVFSPLRSPRMAPTPRRGNAVTWVEVMGIEPTASSMRPKRPAQPRPVLTRAFAAAGDASGDGVP